MARRPTIQFAPQGAPAAVPDTLARLARLEGEAAALIGRFDHVTRLPNRLQFLDEFASLRGPAGRDRCMLMVTLAEARHYNEILRALGHAFADDFVRAGAAQLQAVLPRELSVYHVSVLSFALVVDAGGKDIPPLAYIIARAFGGDIFVNDIPIKARVGVGVLPLNTHADAPEALRAALAAAQDSRNDEQGVAAYNNRSDEAHRRAFRILTDLPAALKRKGELSLVFQPRIRLADNETNGAEALLRWAHPMLGAISPGEFIPLAEQTSLIGPLTDWVLGTALTAAEDFKKAGRELKISVNASPANLAESDFGEKLLALCSRHNVGPEAIEIEFTEGALAGTSDSIEHQLVRLRGAGIEVAIDDFGTGFSNFSRLARMPVDVLKIDQSFIRTLVPGDDFLVRHMLAMAQGMGFRVCAEGIETAESYALLRTLGCDEGQGYFMARPMPAEALRTWRYGA